MPHLHKALSLAVILMELYKSISKFQNRTVELSFKGLSWNDNKNITSNISDLIVTFSENSTTLFVIWQKVFSNCITPIYPWLNHSICLLTNRFVVIAIENRLQFLDLEFGDTICTFIFGNTPIIKLEFSENDNALFILSQCQGFKFDNKKNKSNLYKMTFPDSCFSHEWTAQLHLPEILIEDFTIKELMLTVVTKSENFVINTLTGKIPTWHY